MLYEQKPILYNIKSADFLDRIKKNDAIVEICENLKHLRPDVTSMEVKAKIKTLRGQYIRERNAISKSKKSGAGSDDIGVSKFWCFEELKFLDQYIASTPQYSNIKKTNDTCMLDQSGTSFLPDEPDFSSDEATGRKKESTLEKQISKSLRVAEDLVENVRLRRQNKPSPQYNLGKMVENELEGIPQDLFLDAKWKIMNILQETQRKAFFCSNTENILLSQESTNRWSETPQSSTSYFSSPSSELEEFASQTSKKQSQSKEVTLQRVIPLKVIGSSGSSKTLKISSINQLSPPLSSSSPPHKMFKIASEDLKTRWNSLHHVSSPYVFSEQTLPTDYIESAFEPVVQSCSAMLTENFTFKTSKPKIVNVFARNPLKKDDP